ncbi:hypothetical protein FA13DRAFT_605397 [Coprinellus micaceus]|uniref:WW domain-containing protein n=1 Tax=Coprinellus micaceus TaxID=71717 RepID=A0A4Y7T7P8_COPMI|nr:hypothetical protein FA13DRAFT_605397 [Coprinellus micaceus]
MESWKTRPRSRSQYLQIYDVDADRAYRDQEQSYPRETLNAPQKSDQNSSDRRAHHRRMSSRGSPPPRSQPTLQPPPRLTHALPPKPGLAVVAAAIASPAARGSTSQKGSGATNLSSSSPSYHSNKKPSEWETRTSSKGDTYYYNTVTCKSTWSKPADERDFESDDGRHGTYHVPSSTTFRSSPTVSDRASQDAHRHNEPLRDGDRHYHPETDSGRQAGRYRNAEAGSDSFIEVDYAPGPTRRDRNADNSREQKAYPEDDSRRRSRIPNADTYTPVEDTHPAPTRRRSSPPRGLQSQSQASDRPPIAAPRRRPASPSPPTTLPPSRPGPDAYDRRPYEQALSTATLPKEPRATREVRDERPIEPRRIPTAAAPVAYIRSTNPRYRDEELGSEPSGVTRQARDEERNPSSMRGVPRTQELEGYRSSNPMSVSYDDRRPIYPRRAEIPPTRQRIVEGSGYRPASPPRRRYFCPKRHVRTRDRPGS